VLIIGCSVNAGTFSGEGGEFDNKFKSRLLLEHCHDRNPLPDMRSLGPC
jgi:hypothetical protein